MEFSEKLHDLDREIYDFIKSRDQHPQHHRSPGQGYDLWLWPMDVHPLTRFRELINSSESLIAYIHDGNFEKKSVLDLGCGFCSYWPFLQEYGFNDFVGIDLYSSRDPSQKNPGRGAHRSLPVTLDLLGRFCPNSSTEIYESDVRNIENILESGRKFDLIFAYDTSCLKLDSTGIDSDLFNEIVDKYLAVDGMSIDRCD